MTTSLISIVMLQIYLSAFSASQVKTWEGMYDPDTERNKVMYRVSVCVLYLKSVMQFNIFAVQISPQIYLPCDGILT